MLRLLLSVTALAGGLLISDSARAVEEPREVFYKPGSSLHIFGGKAGGYAPAVLLFHPGGWTEGAPSIVYDAARHFASKGIVGIAVQYRLSGAAATPADAFADACSAFLYVRQNAGSLGVYAQHIAAYGESAGGQLAALSATRGCPAKDGIWRPQLLMLQSPAVDPTSANWFGRILKGAPVDPYRPILFADHNTPPTLIVQGEADTVTPLVLARMFCARIDRPDFPCVVVAYPKLGHYFTRKLKDQEGQFDPFITDSDAEPDVDKAAVEDSRKRFVDFMNYQGFLTR
jgi:acetyl esterase/lipase